MASFVGANGEPDDEKYEDVDEQIAVVKQDSQDTNGSQSAPKDVFEFETNHTPDADSEDK